MRRRELIGVALGGMLPRVSYAQQPIRRRHVSILHPSVSVADMAENGEPQFAAFFTELRRLGYVEGQNIIVDRYSGGGNPDRYRELARHVVGKRPEIIVATSTRVVAYLKEETSSIPIVGITSDPISAGLARSLARPGGNITGVSSDTGLEALNKHFEFLREIVPHLSKPAFLAPRALWEGDMGRAIQQTAGQLGLALLGPPLESPLNPEGYLRVVKAMVQDVAEALIIGSVTENFTHRRLIVDLAAQHRLPAIYPFRELAPIGGLITYAPELRDMYRRVAGYVDRILKGEGPGELPIYQPNALHLAINVKTASELGLTIPPTLLARADEVIE